jgi:hypothetical protein
VKGQAKAGDILVLEFRDETGRMVDGYKLSFGAHELPALPNSGQPARILEMPVSTYLQSANAIRMVGRETELSYDRSTGQMLWCLAGRQPVILSGPALHIMRYPGQPDAYPDPWSWKLSSAVCKPEKGQAVLHWDGSYGVDFSGGFEISMDDAGDVEMAYHFTYNGKQEFSAREIGLELELPAEMSRLEWDRNAEWSYYPGDHIGRPHGVARVHSNVAQTIPPTNRPYAQDDHPWGCNDFRSTKRHIYWATLTNPQGAGIRVISDGSDCIRATMGVDTLAVAVMNHFDGSPGGINEYDAQYGTGKRIKPGETIHGTVRLQLQAGRRAGLTMP